MSKKRTASEENLSQDEIDERVIAEIDDPAAWGEPIEVHRDVPAKLSLSAELAARAEFLARLHHEPNVEQWLMRIIRERVEIEELAFGEAKRDLMVKSRA
jgi:hypothetical protein